MPGPISDSYKGMRGNMPIVPTWMLRDISEEALERGRRERAHLESLGRHRRCDTNICAQDGACSWCGAINGQSCLSPANQPS